jgi:nicotinamide riboside transporter PnuC
MKTQQMKKLHPAMGLLGCLGFQGILGFTLNQPAFCTFFAFFGFFSWFWWAKLSNEPWDERLLANRLRATNKALSLCFGIVFVGMVLVSSLPDFQETGFALHLLISIVSLGFATAMVLTVYLTNKYDQEN